jgi:RimJ/RimL family protein N-acetyltransferase
MAPHIRSDRAGALIAVTDGLISIRARGPVPRAAVIIGDHQTSGWIGYDERSRLVGTRDVHVRCDLPADLRSNGYGGRAVHLLLHHLATRTAYRTAVLRCTVDDAGMLEVAATAGFATCAAHDGARLLARSVPPVAYGDGVVTIRPLRVADIDRHMEAIDDEQIDWLWEPGDRRRWEALSPAQQREHNVQYLRSCQDSFGMGPKWHFSADLADASYVAYVDCDLANPYVPAGEANISYTGHPAYRGQGNVSRAVRLIARFLRDHTGAGSAHIIVDAANTASLRVASAVGAAESGRWIDEHGRTMIRHVLSLR